MDNSNNQTASPESDMYSPDECTDKQSTRNAFRKNTSGTKQKRRPLFSNMRKEGQTIKRKAAKTGKRIAATLLHGFIGFAIGAATSLVVCAIVFDIGRNYNPDNNASQYDLTVLQERIERCNEITTASYLYTTAEMVEWNNAIFGLFDIPGLTGKEFIVKFNGIIKAGVSLDETVIEKGDDGSIQVALPAPYIVSHEIDENSFEVLREHESLFSSIKLKDMQEFRATQKDAMEQRAYESGVMEEAAQNAQESIRNMLEMALPEGTEIHFVQKG